MKNKISRAQMVVYHHLDLIPSWPALIITTFHVAYFTCYDLYVVVSINKSRNEKKNTY